jgi:hypothetical protein
MPIGALIGGVIAQSGLRLPLIVGGTATTLISLSAFKFVYDLGNQTSQGDHIKVTESEPSQDNKLA